MAKNSVTCPACGVEEVVHGEAVQLQDVGEFKCDACGACAVYGRLMPRVVIEPTRGERDLLWIRLRIQDPKTKQDVCEPLDMDPKLAVKVATNLLSLVKV